MYYLTIFHKHTIASRTCRLSIVSCPQYRTVLARWQALLHGTSDGGFERVSQQVPAEVDVGPHVHSHRLDGRVEDIVLHVLVAVRFGEKVGGTVEVLGIVD